MDTADFNGDGFDDLAVLDGGFLVLLLNDGRGNFSAPLLHRRGGLGARQLVARDFNHDAKADVAVGYADGDVWVFLGDGRGDLSDGVKFATGGSPTSLAATDFDADGNVDLVVALAGGSVTGRAQLLRNDGHAAFTRAGTAAPIGRAPQRIAAGDFDRDGHPDVAATNEFDRTVTVLFGDGAGGLADPLTLPTAPPPTTEGEAAQVMISPVPLPYGVAAGDVNGDGLDDLVVANGLRAFSGLPPSRAGTFGNQGGAAELEPPPAVSFGNVALFRNNGDRTFSAPTFLPADNQARDVRILDLDGDGRRDIAAGGWGILALLARSDGSFARGGNTLSAGLGLALTAGDFNHDGLVDLALAPTAPRVDLYFGLGGGRFPSPFFLRTEARPELGVQSPGQVRAADLNHDGIVDLVATTLAPGGPTGAIAAFLGRGDGDFGRPIMLGLERQASWFALADFDGDGNVDIALNNYDNPRYPLDLFPGDGRGRFAPGPRISDDGDFGMVEVADFDEDGRPDLVAVARRYEDPGFVGADVFVNARKGQFRRTASLSTNEATVGLLVGDLDLDGHVDVVGLNGNQPLSVFRGRGDGTFSEQARVAVVTNGPVAGAALADFDEDGFLDLALSQGVGRDTPVFGAFWLRGDGHGSFIEPLHLTPEYAGVDAQTNFLGGVAAQDFNGDGHQDIAVSYFNGVTVFQGDGRGRFAPASAFFALHARGDPDQLMAADLNDDGLIDLTTAADGFLELAQDRIYSGVRLTLLFNTTPPAALVSGDANCDGAVSGSDLGALSRRFFSPVYLPACSGADANGDASITTADLTATIQRLEM